MWGKKDKLWLEPNIRTNLVTAPLTEVGRDLLLTLCSCIRRTPNKPPTESKARRLWRDAGRFPARRGFFRHTVCPPQHEVEVVSSYRRRLWRFVVQPRSQPTSGRAGTSAQGWGCSDCLYWTTPLFKTAWSAPGEQRWQGKARPRELALNKERSEALDA